MPIRSTFALLAAIACSSMLPAQLSGTAVVATRTSVTPATLLLQVDLATGLYTARPRFASDHLPALAVAVDPTDGSVLMALDDAGRSRIVRLPANGGEIGLGSIAGICRELLVDRRGGVIVLIGGAGGGVHRLPRHGGAAVLLHSVPFASAAGTLSPLAWGAVVASDGSAAPARDPGLGDFDFDNGQYSAGPFAFAGFTPLGIDGLIDLPTALPRQLLAHDDGSFSLYSSALTGNPLPVGSTPTLPPGGAVAMHCSDRGLGLVLGSSSSPYLRAFDPYTALSGAMALSVVAGPLPGDPIDYALLPDGGAGVLTFASACGSAAELYIGPGNGGLPQPGNQAFALALYQGVPQQPAMLGLGFMELPGVPLPNGCAALVLPAVVLLQSTDANGDASQPLPLPNQPALLGLTLMAQWFQFDGAVPFATSGVAAVRIGS